MAGNTIAKLAVVVTTDTGPMAQGFRRGSDIIKKSAGDMDGKFNRTAESLKFLKDAAGASTGSVRDMVGVLRSGAGPLGIAAVGVAALGVGMLKTAQAADALAMRSVKSADEIEAAYKKATGREIDIGFNKIDTWTGQWERLKEAVIQFGGALGNRIGTVDAYRRATEYLADSLARLAERFKTDDQRRDEKNLETSRKGLELQIKQHERILELGKKQNDQALEAIRERGRLMEEAARKAASVIESVKTPAEQFDDKIAELIKLSSEGLLSDDFFERAFRAAQEEFKKKTKTKTDTEPSIGAVERFTAAGFSAANRTNEQKKLEENTKTTAVATTNTARHTSAILAALEKQSTRTPDLMVSNF